MMLVVMTGLLRMALRRSLLKTTEFSHQRQSMVLPRISAVSESPREVQKTNVSWALARAHCRCLLRTLYLGTVFIIILQSRPFISPDDGWLVYQYLVNFTCFCTISEFILLFRLYRVAQNKPDYSNSQIVRFILRHPVEYFDVYCCSLYNCWTLFWCT